MRQYLECGTTSQKEKQGWSITDLGRNIEQAFRSGDAVVRWAVHDCTTGELIVCFYHTPVTKQLCEQGEKFGNYMHSMRRLRPASDDWWGLSERGFRNG